jgi:uncharacterized membrane protein (DUF106 family)
MVKRREFKEQTLLYKLYFDGKKIEEIKSRYRNLKKCRRDADVEKKMEKMKELK